jgi:hypothetical protein
MSEKKITQVYSVNSSLQAVNIQDVLEKAGIPVTILRSESGFAVMVPLAWVWEVHELLYPECRSGEIYFVPAHPLKLNYAKA